MIRLTFVCSDCNAGWEVQVEEGQQADDLGKRCRWCGKEGKLRGSYGVVSLKEGDSDPTPQ